jgi:acetylornithine deacetylase
MALHVEGFRIATVDPVIALLSDLVANNSVNPSLVPGAPGEAAVAEIARAFMASAGLDVEVQDVLPGRPNVIGVLEGREPGATVMLCGHLDTVGVEGMDAPFSPRVDDGRLNGRGSQDMKGGVAAMLGAAAVLAKDWPRGKLIVAGVIDEEYQSAGAEALVKTWKADAAIVTEPTDLQLAVAHKGFAWVEVTTRGRAAHGSRPAEGRDAIMRMGRVLAALELRDKELQARPSAGLQGVASLHASIISGGRELSVYPDQCVLQLERRTVSGEEGKVPLAEVEGILTRLRAQDNQFDASAKLMTSRPPYALDPGHALPQALSASLAARKLYAMPSGASFWTDAAILAAAGIPSVLFGPSGAGLHSIEEYVDIDSVLVCRDVLCDAVRSYVGADL